MSIIKNNKTSLTEGKTILSKVFFSLLFATVLIFTGVTFAAAQTATIGNIYAAYPDSDPGDPYYCTNTVTEAADGVSFLTTDRGAAVAGNPAVNSALIEYDQPATHIVGGNTNPYPNHCLHLCVEVKCSSFFDTISPSPSFPIQTVKFEIFKFLEQSDPYDNKSTPAIKTVQFYPGKNNTAFKCAGYRMGTTEKEVFPECSIGTASPEFPANTCTAKTNGSRVNDENNVLTFCTPWDGSYNFDSEFAKTNGVFGLRANIYTEYTPRGPAVITFSL
ncbi:hypothetical protein Dip510_000991 [Elusimicrobium posterum]|uniref:hypothetical protein n=1 Tax=Elusimicrobium posterum TaxID=3116653 RepID=UPI003C7088FA